MKSSRILKSRAVRVLAVSTTLLVGVSTAAAAGALPGTGQHDAASVHAAALLPRPGVDGSAQAKVQADAHGPLPRLGDVGAAADLGANAGAGGAAGVSAGGAGGLDVTTTAGGVGAGGTGSRKGAATVKGAVAGGVNLGGAGSGLVSGLSGLGTAVTGCLNSVLSTATGNPLIAVGSVLPTVVACVKNIIGSLPVPAFVSSCVSGLLGALNSLPVVGSGTGQIDLTGCLPINLSTCVAAAINSIGGLLGGLTGVSNVPSSIVACASSIVNGVLSLINSLPGQVTGAVSGGVGVGLGASAHASARLGTH